MSEVKDVSEEPEQGSDEPAYEPPHIAWREPYEPVGFGISCAKQPQNPGCNVLPSQ
jgi:hypothetical protein